MKWIYALLFFLSSLKSYSQATEDTTKYIKYQNQYGQQLPRLWAPRILRVPYKDTSSEHPQGVNGAIMMGLDGNMYKWDSSKWKGIAEGGLNLQQVTTAGKKTTDTITTGGLRTQHILTELIDSNDFEIDIVPDIQGMTETYPHDILFPMFSFWKDSSVFYNIKAVLQVGDLTNTGVVQQFMVADTAFKSIDTAGVPWLAVMGNHDYITGNARPLIRNADNFNTVFGPSRFTGKSFYGGNFLNSDENYYIKFNAGPYKFLAIGLEFLPRDSALDWAQRVVDSFPDRRIFIISHHYQTFWGEKSRDTSVFGSKFYMPGVPNLNNGQQMWDKFVRKNKNIDFVCNGHDVHPILSLPITNRITEASVPGNVVYQIMVNYQNDTHFGDGYFMRLKFKPRTGKIDVSIYSSTLKITDTRFPPYTLDYPATKIEAAVGVSGVNGSFNVGGEVHVDSGLFVHQLSAYNILRSGKNGRIDTVAYQTANKFLASPSSATGKPDFRAITNSDISTSLLVNNGTAKDGDTIKLGQTISASGDPAKFNTNREIPSNGFNMVFTGTGKFGIGTNAPGFKNHIVGTLGVMPSSLNFQSVFNSSLPASIYAVSTGGNWGINIQRGSANAGAAILSFYKTRNSDPGTKTPSQSGDGVGDISFQTVAGDGTTIEEAAGILITVDSQRTSSTPSSIRFFNASIGGGISEKMRINSYGFVGIGTSSPAYALDVVGALRISDSITALRLSTGDILDSNVVYNSTSKTFKKLSPQRPYLVYTALVSQSGTSAPVLTVFENNLGATITASRTSTGDYNLTASASVFTSSKTGVIIGPPTPSSVDNFDSFGYERTSATVIRLYSAAGGGSNHDGVFNETMVEIRVYR